MTEFLIRYQDAEGNLSERRISNIEVQDSSHIHAYCHKRAENRTFKLSRIVSAVDAKTGEVIEDMSSFMGVAPPEKPPPPLPAPTPVGTKAVQRLRNKEKRDLFKPFVLAVVEDLVKKRFFNFFGNTCFKCGAHSQLVIDHHVPIIRGGHLVPGNLVALCSPCNNRKADVPPESFYTRAELERLQGHLDNQHSVFAFSFDWDAWKADRERYLLSLGIDAELVREALSNPGHRFYIGQPNETDGVIITIAAPSLLVMKV